MVSVVAPAEKRRQTDRPGVLVCDATLRRRASGRYGQRVFDVRATFSRRRLLRLGLGAGVVVAGAIGLGAWGLLRHQPARPGLKVLSEGEAAVVVAVADAYFPPGNPFGRAAVDLDVAGVLDAYLFELFPRERRGIRTLLRGLEAWPRLTLMAGPFSTASLPERQAVLQAFDDSAIAERRMLGALLRQLCCMAMFEDARLLAGIGHRQGCGLPIYDELDAGIGG
jgi:hypothetical protein